MFAIARRSGVALGTSNETGFRKASQKRTQLRGFRTNNETGFTKARQEKATSQGFQIRQGKAHVTNDKTGFRRTSEGEAKRTRLQEEATGIDFTE